MLVRVLGYIIQPSAFLVAQVSFLWRSQHRVILNIAGFLAYP